MAMARRALVLAACVLMGGAAWLGALADEPPDEPLAVGTVAPDFSISTLEGTELSLAAWRDHVVVVNFFITWYRDAARHLAIMEALSAKYSPQGLRVLSISLDEGQAGLEATRAFVSANNVAHPVAADPQQQVAKRYGVRALPAIFVIGGDGKIRAYHEGYMEGDDQKIAELVAAALGTQQPAPSAGESGVAAEAAPQEPVCKCFKQKPEQSEP